MKIRFQGEVDLPFADDRGSYDIWLLDAIEQALFSRMYSTVKEGPETDDIYTKLNLSWEPVNEDTATS